MEVRIDIRAVDGAVDSLHLAELVNRTLREVDERLRNSIMVELDRDEIETVMSALVYYQRALPPKELKFATDLAEKIYTLRYNAKMRGARV